MEELHLRAMEPKDCEYMYLAENDPTTWNQGVIMVPISRHTLRRFIDSSCQPISESGQIRLIAENRQDGIPVGIVDLFEIDLQHQRAGVGILVYPPALQGRGYGQHLLQLLLKYARETLQLHQLYAEIRVDNTKSLRLFVRAGFRTIGTKQEWLRCPEGYVDVKCLQKLL